MDYPSCIHLADSVTIARKASLTRWPFSFNHRTYPDAKSPAIVRKRPPRWLPISRGLRWKTQTMRASADLVAGITMLALFAAGTVAIIAAEAVVWTVVGWVGRK